MGKEKILDKHLKKCIRENKKHNWQEFNQMKKSPEYKAVLDAMTELETTLVKNYGDLHGVSVSFFKHLELQLKYHKEKENERAECRDYREAMYHNHRGGAIEDLIMKIKNER